MKYIFRDQIVFEYLIDEQRVIQHQVEGTSMAAFDYCKMIGEDYGLLAYFFTLVSMHIKQMIGEKELKDIIVS